MSLYYKKVARHFKRTPALYIAFDMLLFLSIKRHSDFDDLSASYTLYFYLCSDKKFPDTLLKIPCYFFEYVSSGIPDNAGITGLYDVFVR